MPINIGIVGITGKMGTLISAIAKRSKDFNLIGGIGSDSSKDAIFGKKRSNFLDLAKDADILLDFSSPLALDKLLEAAESHKVKLIIGTSGYSENDLKKIELAAKKTPILYSTNFSLGMAICKFLVSETARRFKEVNTVDIVEKHHTQKKDAPSGSSKTLAEILKKEGKDVNIHSLRLANVVGEHTLYFISDEERIVIEHAAQSREVFAKGALVAAKFLYKQKEAKLYTIEDLFNE